MFDPFSVFAPVSLWLLSIRHRYEASGEAGYVSASASAPIPRDYTHPMPSLVVISGTIQGPSESGDFGDSDPVYSI